MTDDYMLDAMLDKIKMIIDDTKILIDRDNKFADEVTLKYVVVLISRNKKMVINFIWNYL